MDLEQVRQEIKSQGYFIQHQVLSPEFVKQAKKELLLAIEQEAQYHGSTHYNDYAMVLLCSLYGGTFLNLLDQEKFLAPFEAVLGEGCIVYAYTSSSLPPQGGNYSTRIHVDCPRIVPNYVTNMGATLLLDDFTEENGATWFLPGSQEREHAPSSEEFYGKGKRMIAPAGSVLYFNARLWHASAPNQTSQWRHALTLNMCRPFMKQRLDIPRAMAGIDLTSVSPRVLQKLGFHSRVPESYDQYYGKGTSKVYLQKTE